MDTDVDPNVEKDSSTNDWWNCIPDSSSATRFLFLEFWLGDVLGVIFFPIVGYI
jgi:hypothetical protein